MLLTALLFSSVFLIHVREKKCHAFGLSAEIRVVLEVLIIPNQHLWEHFSLVVFAGILNPVFSMQLCH